jgi:nitronate monooxygenase
MGEVPVAIDWSGLALPVMAAPMFIVSDVKLVVACCRSGVIGAFPSGNPRATDTLDTWLSEIRAAEAESLDRGERFAPLVLTNLGDPRAEVEAAHAWGGIVFHDVTTMRFAEKAIAAGVDGLMLVCGGAGGHAGTLNPFTFLPQVRRIFGGTIMLAGGIADGNGIAAALALGADLVVMGTRFIATRESGAAPAHKAMLVSAAAEDVMFTDAIAGLPASFLKPSMLAAGLDPDRLPPPLGMHRPNLPAGVKAWKTVWSGGHSTGLIEDVPGVAELVTRLQGEFAAARHPGDWRAALSRGGTIA